METKNPATPAELYAHLYESLGLSTHTVVFHIVETDNGEFAFGRGSVMDVEPLNEDDAFNQIADRLYYEPYVYVESAITYMLGDGETEAATCEELAAIEKAFERYPDLFDGMIAEYAEPLYRITDSNVANPAYDEDELDAEV